MLTTGPCKPAHRERAAIVELDCARATTAPYSADSGFTRASPPTAAAVDLPRSARQQLEQRVHRALGRALLRAASPRRARRPSAARSSSFSSKLQHGCGQRLGSDYSQRVSLTKDVDDVAKVFRVRPHQNGCSELRGFQNIVSAARHQAAADERQIGELVEAGQLANACRAERRRLRSVARHPTASAAEQLRPDEASSDATASKRCG